LKSTAVDKTMICGIKTLGKKNGVRGTKDTQNMKICKLIINKDICVGVHQNGSWLKVVKLVLWYMWRRLCEGTGNFQLLCLLLKYPCKLSYMVP
jgi:hypothetical protein